MSMVEVLHYLLLPDASLFPAFCMGMAAAWWTIRRERQLPPYKRNAWLECALTSVKSTPSKSSAGGSKKGIHWLR